MIDFDLDEEKMTAASEQGQDSAMLVHAVVICKIIKKLFQKTKTVRSYVQLCT